MDLTEGVDIAVPPEPFQDAWPRPGLTDNHYNRDIVRDSQSGKFEAGGYSARSQTMTDECPPYDSRLATALVEFLDKTACWNMAAASARIDPVTGEYGGGVDFFFTRWCCTTDKVGTIPRGDREIGSAAFLDSAALRRYRTDFQRRWFADQMLAPFIKKQEQDGLVWIG